MLGGGSGHGCHHHHKVVFVVFVICIYIMVLKVTRGIGGSWHDFTISNIRPRKYKANLRSERKITVGQR